MSGATEQNIVARGAFGTVEYAVQANGASPAQEFVETELDLDNQRKLAVLLEKLANQGRISNEEQFKKVEGSLFELKQHQVRVFCFQEGRRWILTHGFIKKRPKLPKTEIQRGERIRQEHLTRESLQSKSGRQRS